MRSKILADGQRDFVAQFDIELHGIAPQIDVAIFQAHFFVGEHGVGGQKRQRLRHIEDAQLFDHQFDFAGGDIGIDGVGIAALDLADSRDDEFVAQGFGFFMNGGIQFVIEYDLGNASAVAQVNEDDLAEVAAAVDPSHEHNLFACIGEPKRSAHMSSFEIT